MNRVNQWSCQICTLYNNSSQLLCEACMSPRPSAAGEGAIASIRGEASRESRERSTPAQDHGTIVAATATPSAYRPPQPQNPSPIALAPSSLSPAAQAAVLRSTSSATSFHRPPMQASSRPAPRSTNGGGSSCCATPSTCRESESRAEIHPDLSSSSLSQSEIHEWQCINCTYLNHPLLHVCEMCESGRLIQRPMVVID